MLNNSPVTGAMASKFGNTYYHPRYCVKKKWPEFIPTQLCVLVEIVEHLTIVYLLKSLASSFSYIHHVHILVLL